MKVSLGRGAAAATVATLLGACSSPALTISTMPDADFPEAGAADASATDPMWCGRGTDVKGAKPADGFCLKHYASVGEARALALAPNGDLFVAGPSRGTPGGASGGPGAIVLLTDDDHDGVAAQSSFLTQLDGKTQPDDVHGLALGGG